MQTFLKTRGRKSEGVAKSRVEACVYRYVVHSACVYNTWVNGSRQQLQLPRSSTLRMRMWTHSRWEYYLIHCCCVYLGYTPSATSWFQSPVCVYIIYSTYISVWVVGGSNCSVDESSTERCALFWPGVFFPPTSPPLFFQCYSCWWRSSSRRPPPQQQQPHCNITLPRTRLNTVLLGKSPRQIPGNLGGGVEGGRPTSHHTTQPVRAILLWHGAVGRAGRAVQLRRAWPTGRPGQGSWWGPVRLIPGGWARAGLQCLEEKAGMD